MRFRFHPLKKGVNKVATQVGVTGICALGITAIAVDNIVRHKDPFPALLAGGLFTVGCSVVSEVDTGLATALASVFLVSALLIHSTGTAAVLTKLASQPAKPVVKTSDKDK
jgi:hypothetical protein